MINLPRHLRETFYNPITIIDARNATFVAHANQLQMRVLIATRTSTRADARIRNSTTVGTDYRPSSRIAIGIDGVALRRTSVGSTINDACDGTDYRPPVRSARSPASSWTGIAHLTITLAFIELAPHTNNRKCLLIELLIIVLAFSGCALFACTRVSIYRTFIIM